MTYQKFSGETTRKSISAHTKSELIKKKNNLIMNIMQRKISDTSDITMVDLLKEDAEFDYQHICVVCFYYTSNRVTRLWSNPITRKVQYVTYN